MKALFEGGPMEEFVVEDEDFEDRYFPQDHGRYTRIGTTEAGLALYRWIADADTPAWKRWPDGAPT